jgi:hypothetical protein
MNRNKIVDMSPEAIAARLEALGALYRLSMSLKTAKRLGRVEDLQKAKSLLSEESKPATE